MAANIRGKTPKKDEYYMDKFKKEPLEARGLQRIAQQIFKVTGRFTNQL